jgi:hypothetical protein
MGLTRCRRNGKWRTSARRGYYRYRFVAARPIPGSGHDGRACLLFPLSQRGCRLRPEDYSEIVAAGWSWASGGIVSTPSDLNEFIRGYVGGELFDRRTRAQQRRVLEGGSSEPPGPGYNSAGRLPLPDEVRDGVGSHGQYSGLHPVHGGQPRRQPLCGSVRQRTTHPHNWGSGRL